jgi:hypothetical protein
MSKKKKRFKPRPREDVTVGHVGDDIVDSVITMLNTLGLHPDDRTTAALTSVNHELATATTRIANLLQDEGFSGLDALAIVIVTQSADAMRKTTFRDQCIADIAEKLPDGYQLVHKHNLYFIQHAEHGYLGVDGWQPATSSESGFATKATAVIEICRQLDFQIALSLIDGESHETDKDKPAGH